MNRVIVDLTGCTGTEPPYVSRATSLDGLVVLCDFDARQITKRWSEDLILRKEFSRLTLLKWQTIMNHGCGVERLRRVANTLLVKEIEVGEQ